MRHRLKKMLFLLDARTRLQLAGMFLLILLGALLEMFSIGLVFPFTSLIDDPSRVTQVRMLHVVFQALGEPPTRLLFIWLGVGLIGVFVFKNLYLVAVAYLQYRFVKKNQIATARNLFVSYLNAPYTFHLQRNSAELLRNVSNEVLVLYRDVLRPTILLLTEVTITIGITTLLAIVEPLTTLVTIAGLGLAMAMFYLVFQRQITQLGYARQHHLGLLLKQAQQGFSGIKEIKVLGRGAYFRDQYHVHSARYFRAVGVQLWVRSLPRYYTETVAVTGILLVILILLTQGREMGTVLPTLSLFAAAAYRLVPSANRIVSLVHQIRHNAYALDTIYDGLVLSEQPGRGRGTLQDSQIVEALPPIRDGVRLENVTYRYSDPPTTALRDISLYIPRGHIVGFVGPSGAGKTTVVDVILGLLTPTEGRVLVDGHDIQDNLRAWQAKLGYIPQEIYLLDDTLRANIAFGIQPDQIDETSVLQAVKAAQLGEWIESLPDGLDTMVGEEGVRISGGQRQRVGIARALYHNPELLIMDEATASLDNQMEAEVMKAILRLSGQKTILIIAHRLTTVKNCHRLYFMQYGRIVASGTYDELLDYSAEFQAMARLVDDR